MTKYRTPPCCVICSTKKAREQYEGVSSRGFFNRPGKADNIAGLQLCSNKISEVEYMCPNCKWSRPDPEKENDGVTKLWFVSCKKCGQRHISNEIDKCASCDLGWF